MKNTSQQSGFSLVETLVAITILLIVITGPLAISSSAAKSSSFSSEQITAFFLAQEGVELVEKARDDLLIPYFAGANPDPWADFTRTAVGGLYRRCYVSLNPTGCGFRIGTDTAGTVFVNDCSATRTACNLYLDKTTPIVRSRYATAGDPTPFKRVITLELVNPDEVKVVSKVTWRTGALKQEQEAVVESRLFNIYGS